MIANEFNQVIEFILSNNFGETKTALSIDLLSGGDTAKAVKVSSNSGVFFIKVIKGKYNPFITEKHGLDTLRGLNLFSIPAIIDVGSTGDYSYLLSEYVSTGTQQPDFWQHFGENLANQHRHTSSGGLFGLDHSNYIGRLHQENTWEKDWTTFFIKRRLEPQVELAGLKGFIDKSNMNSFRKLFMLIQDLLVAEPPSLLHGDLWSGNFIVGRTGYPFLIDPTIYYGNREIELSLTLLLGGFHQDFYSSYNESWPLEKGFLERSELYNLYPLLVHLNLFGKSYLPSINKVLRRFS